MTLDEFVISDQIAKVMDDDDCPSNLELGLELAEQ